MTTSLLSFRCWLVLASLAVVTCSVSPALAQAPTSGWRMPTLNPFAKSNDNRPTTEKVIDPFGLIPGTVGGKTSNASFGQNQQPSMWQRATAGPKKVMNQTADFLNPFNDAPAPTREENLTGKNSIFSQQANKRPVQTAKENTSWFPGWPGGNPSNEAKPKTVNDFLSQPRLAP